MPLITVLGGLGKGGTYLLRIRVRRDIRVIFGRFRRGVPIPIRSGEYCYVGSALGEKGGTALGSRLLRHATRSRAKTPHGIRMALARTLTQAGMAAGVPREKRLRWNIDHLLDRKAANLMAVIVARNPERLESLWAGLLESDPHTRVVEKGLGAGDVPGSTHLLRVEAGEGWWAGLPHRLASMGECR